MQTNKNRAYVHTFPGFIGSWTHLSTSTSHCWLLFFIYIFICKSFTATTYITFIVFPATMELCSYQVSKLINMDWRAKHYSTECLKVIIWIQMKSARKNVHFLRRLHLYVWLCTPCVCNYVWPLIPLVNSVHSHPCLFVWTLYTCTHCVCLYVSKHWCVHGP